jgi:outer membrane biosynthesis protein TonB
LGENSVSGPAEVGTMVGGEWVDPFDSVPLLVLVKDGDKPVAGARFYDLMTGNKPLQAISDERGRALLRVRLQGKPGNRSVNTYVRYRFQAEGYAEGTVTAQLARRLAAPKKQAAEAGAKKGPKKKGVAAKKGPAAKKAEGAKEAPGPIALELPEVEEIEEEAEEEEPEPEPVPVPQDPAPPVKPVKPVKKAPPAKKDVKKAAKQDPKKAKEAAKAAAKKAQGRAGAVIPLGNPAAGQIVQILGLGANNAQGKNGPIQLSEDRDPEELLASGNPDIVIEAKPALRLRGQLLLGEGIPAAHVPIVLDSRLQRVAQNLRINVSWGSNNNERVFRTDAEGRFEIPCIRPGADVSLRALLRAEQLAVLSNTRRAALSPAVWFYVAQAPDKAQTQDLGELRLDQLSCLSIRSRHQSGVPARGAKLIFSAASSLSTDINHHRSDYVLNRRGQIALLYPAGSKFAVAVATDGGFIERKLESPKEAAASQDIDLQMTEPIWITGIIRNNAGKPIPGARVQASQLGGRTAQMLLRNLMNRSVETDSAGRFRLPALPESRYYLFAHYSGPTRNQKKGQRRVANMQRPVVLTVEESAPELVELTMDVELPEKEAGKKQ